MSKSIQERLKRLENLYKSLCCKSGGSSIPSYQVYTALISQTGTSNPTVIVLENTIGDIVWTFDSNGEYLGTLTGVFVSNKTYFSALPSQITQLKFVRVNNDIVNLGTALAGVKTNGLLNNTSIEIRIYN